ncbi:hypothetical protein FSP39_024659 [Pinctada imbricata]|uniref:PCNA-associated factor n=1 Tax=Pinctada imbricata TaxID=66713 RepID=A0AA89BN02_PINIB|nr:hypothetical protein FSP39_024659 [Pinctada imbricata]
MVRTKADAGSSSSGAGRKAVGARAPRKALGGASSSSSVSDSPSGKNAKYAGGNPACPRPTPEWQKEISSFFKSPCKGKENATPQEEDNTEQSTAACSSEKE